jgi:hypothetical protein
VKAAFGKCPQPIEAAQGCTETGRWTMFYPAGRFLYKWAQMLALITGIGTLIFI